MPKISIIIPVYNTAQYLKICLDSVLAQTFTDFEAICVNDGSTDGSQLILEEYVQKDSRFRLINQHNQGVAFCRNIALKTLQGDYIAFLDSDDYWHPDFLKTLYEGMITTKADIVACSFVGVHDYNEHNIDSTDITSNWQIFNNPLNVLLSEKILISFTLWNKLYRKDHIVNKFSFIEGIYFSDWPFLVCLFSELRTLAFINHPLYCYYLSQDSMIRSRWSIQKINSYQIGIEEVYRFFLSKNDPLLLATVKKMKISETIARMLDFEFNDWFVYKDQALRKHFRQVLYYFKKQHLLDSSFWNWGHKIKFIDVMYSLQIYVFLKFMKQIIKKLFQRTTQG